MSAPPLHPFAHERLDCYRLALGVARFAATLRFPLGRAHLRDQLIRASDSLVLNLAEGLGQPRGAARRNHLRIALGSAAEACAVLDLVTVPEASQRQGELRRIGAMLTALGR